MKSAWKEAALRGQSSMTDPGPHGLPCRLGNFELNWPLSLLLQHTLGEELDVAHHSLDVVSHEADITVERQQAGGSSVYDVARAQALVAQVRSSIPELEGQRRAAFFELTALLGRTPAEAPKNLDGCVAPPHLLALIPVGDGSALIKRRPDVRQAERRLAAATAEIGVVT